MSRILLAPLDWGLGHATRSIPLICELERQGCEVVIAGSGHSLELLRREFPHIKSFELPAYEPKYPSRGSMIWTMACQVPRFMRVISAEHKMVEGLIRRENIDRLISDNRYGCWSSKIPCAFITHQSNVLMPKRFGWLQNSVRKLSDKMINHYDVCWIPDFPGDHSLAGDLVQFGRSNINIKTEYIGWLSRFKPKNKVGRKYDVLVIFSGPEPQRTILEDRVLPQLKRSDLNYLAVRGLPAADTSQPDGRIVNFLTSARLQHEIESADVIISRSGFSTVMDMHALGKKVIFIPTPGQTEQEYLANRLTERRIAFHMKQDSFDLATALEKSKTFSGFTPLPDPYYFRKALSAFLA